jgi:hypothetical protein
VLEPELEPQLKMELKVKGLGLWVGQQQFGPG